MNRFKWCNQRLLSVLFCLWSELLRHQKRSGGFLALSRSIWTHLIRRCDKYWHKRFVLGVVLLEIFYSRQVCASHLIGAFVAAKAACLQEETFPKYTTDAVGEAVIIGGGLAVFGLTFWNKFRMSRLQCICEQIHLKTPRYCDHDQFLFLSFAQLCLIARLCVLSHSLPAKFTNLVAQREPCPNFSHGSLGAQVSLSASGWSVLPVNGDVQVAEAQVQQRHTSS